MGNTNTEDYKVQIRTSLGSGLVVRESWRQDGELHRIGAAAHREFDEHSGKLVKERWLENGYNHRIGNAPCMTEWDIEFGTVIYEMYCINGQCHRDIDQPSQIWFDPKSGVRTRECYFYADLEHRLSGPAEVERDPVTEIVTLERWAINGKLTRENDKPAATWHNSKTGILVREEHWLNNELHRDGSPAIIIYDEKTGSVVTTEYYQHGIKIDKSSSPKNPSI